MTMYRTWFDHQDGPYSRLVAAESEQDIEECYGHDPFFICVVPAESNFVPGASLQRGGQ